MFFIWELKPEPYILRALFTFVLGKMKCGVCIVCLGSNLSVAKNGASVEQLFGQ